MSYVALLLFAFALSAANAQSVVEILDLQVAGGGDRNGYIQATVLFSNGSTATGPVCGSADGITAIFACYSKGFYSSSAQGTVATIGGISTPTASPVVSNLRCNSYSNNNGQVTYGCTFSSSASCSPSGTAAVECILTLGEIVGIGIGCIIFFLLICVTPCVICCCVCGFVFYKRK